MRTTVTLEPEAQQIIADRMNAEKLSFKRALNDAILASAIRQVDYVYQTEPINGRLLVDITKANSVASCLEDTALLAKVSEL